MVGLKEQKLDKVYGFRNHFIFLFHQLKCKSSKENRLIRRECTIILRNNPHVNKVKCVGSLAISLFKTAPNKKRFKIK